MPLSVYDQLYPDDCAGWVAMKQYRARTQTLFSLGQDYRPDGNVLKQALQYYLTDHLASARRLYPSASNWAADYLPYGQVDARTGTEGECRFGFTGHETDYATELLYAGARYYDPETGRWLQTDPMADDYPEWSTYSYAADNPNRYTDPAGKYPCDTSGDGYVDADCLPEVVIEADKWPSRAGEVFAGTLLVAGVMVADDATVIGIADDPAIPFVVVGGTLTAVGFLVYDCFKPQESVYSYTPPPLVLPGFPDAKLKSRRGARRRWIDSKGKILEWDSLHGEVEVYNRRGEHEGSFDPDSGRQLKPRVPGRTTER